MTLDGERSERRRRALRDLLSFVSLTLSVLCCLFFMLAMHYLAVAIAPKALFHTPEVLIVSVVAVAIAVGTSVSTESKQRGCFGLAAAIVVIYMLAAIIVSFSTNYPGVYTLPYAFFGVLGTSSIFSSFSTVSRLFASIPKWREDPETYSVDFVRDELIEFDRRIRFITASVMVMVGVFVVTAVIALSTTDNVTGWFLLLAAPFLWMATVLMVYSRIVLRLKRMFIEGHEVEERHVIQPVAYTVLASVVLLVAAGILAADASMFHYSTFIHLIENLFGIQRSGSSTIGMPGSEIPIPIGRSTPPPNAGGMSDGGPAGGADLQALLSLLRYIALGGAVIALAVYLILNLIRIRHGGERPLYVIRRSIHRGRDRLKLAYVRLIRILRVFTASMRGIFALWGRRRDARARREEIRFDGQSASEEALKRIERNAVLRWYRRLLNWGKRHGIEASRSSTADEYLELVAEHRPEHSELVSTIAATFDAAFYSPARIGRRRLRAYVRDVKTLVNS